MESFAGRLLVAAPQLADPNFARSLVLLIQHNSEGAFGVIVNRPIQKTVQQLWREIGSSACHCHQSVYLGGPVPGPLLSLHAKPELSEAEPFRGVFFAAKKTHLDKLVLEESPDYKIFIGHSGWGANQLESEINQGAWRVATASPDMIFSTDEMLWENVFRKLGREVLKSMININNLPPDPSVN